MAGVEFSFLKTFLRKTHNREVNEWFRDIYEDETFNTGRPRLNELA